MTEWILKQCDSRRGVFFLKNNIKIKTMDMSQSVLYASITLPVKSPWKSCPSLVCSLFSSLLTAHVLHLCLVSCLFKAGPTCLPCVDGVDWLCVPVFVCFSLWGFAAGYPFCVWSSSYQIEDFAGWTLCPHSAALTGSTGVIWSCGAKVL